MGSEGDDAEAAAAGAIDSDGSVSWEEFFGTSTDLVPQLLGMFDELARRGECCSYDDHRMILQSEGSCDIPVAIQKRLSLVPHSHRNSIFGQLCSSEQAMLVLSRSQTEATMKSLENERNVKDIDDGTKDNSIDSLGSNVNFGSNVELESREIVRENKTLINDTTRAERMNEQTIYRRESNGLTPLRYSGRCSNRGTGCRPLSGSSIASSTSSSGCSNQGNARVVNPYLTSVESLADNCASSQGSGDSGVVTISETSCRNRDVGVNERRGSADGHSPIYHKSRYCDPHRNPVERVLMEIVDTEAIYVEHLRQVIQGYLIFWRDDPAGLVRQLQLNDLFSNIEDIFEFNREFLKEIEECGLNPVRVANTFIKHNAGFKVYTEYCTNYPRTVSVLTDLMGQETTANAFRERQTALGHALPLGSFLLKPVQRILKYHLLLENLSKEYGAGCEQNGDKAKGQTAIEGALEAMTGIAKHINAMKRRHEHAVRVQEIQSLLYGWPGPDLTTSGELVAEGRFRMRGAKAPRHAFLFERMLLLTKKKEDGLLVYKAHILCSNLMLIESIPGEPCSFHVIPFDNPRLQYTLQARNVEQKREWALQIKRVILENYNAVIPLHARQLVLELGQSQLDDDNTVDKGSAKKQYSAPPEYLEKRKQEKERRSEAGLRQKLKKNSGKLENNTGTSIENSPVSQRREQSEDSLLHSSRDRSLNRSLDARASKVKDRFTNWRRKSEPGFQSYVSLNQSDNEEILNVPREESGTPERDCEIQQQRDNDTETNIQIERSSSVGNKDVNEQQQQQEQEQQQQQPQTQVQTQTVEQIVGHILMQNIEFHKLLEKQRNNSIINVRHQQRFNKHVSAETSDESDTDHTNYSPETAANNNNNNNNYYNNNKNKDNRTVRSINREQRLIRTNNAWNTYSSPQPRSDIQSTLQLRYDNLRTENDKVQTNNNDTTRETKITRVDEKKRIFEAFKRQSIVTDSKIIKTALRMRENSGFDESNLSRTKIENISDDTSKLKVNCRENVDNSAAKDKEESVTKGFENYDNLQHVWDGLRVEKEHDNESPTKPAIWLTKLCEDLPVSTQKAGSLPRSFQINPNAEAMSIRKTRFLHRDGKPMSERPITIASDKPAEINLEDMERYASSCQPEGRIAKFPTIPSTSSSTFFLTLDDNLTDAYSEIHAPVTSNNIHPDHKIYRANISGSAIFKNVLSKAGNKLQVLRTTMSTETLESNEEFERTKYSRSLSDGKTKKKSRMKFSRETSSDVDDYSIVGCVSTGGPNFKIPAVYYKQGSSGLGARIAQSDYADPSFLFSEYKRTELALNETREIKKKDEHLESVKRRESETDSFYEKSFENIENYVDADGDDSFRDSAIFSDTDETLLLAGQTCDSNSFQSVATNPKIAPPVPAKRKPRIAAINTQNVEESKSKPVIARKPKNLTIRTKILSPQNVVNPVMKVQALKKISRTNLKSFDRSRENSNKKMTEETNDVSAGQSQAGWVRKMVGQLQAHADT